MTDERKEEPASQRVTPAFGQDSSRFHNVPVVFEDAPPYVLVPGPAEGDEMTTIGTAPQPSVYRFEEGADTGECRTVQVACPCTSSHIVSTGALVPGTPLLDRFEHVIVAPVACKEAMATAAATTTTTTASAVYEPVKVDEVTFGATRAKWNAVCNDWDSTVMLTPHDVVIIVSTWSDRDEHLKDPGWIDFTTKHMNTHRCDDIWYK
jgi:hypothetical protein